MEKRAFEVIFLDGTSEEIWAFSANEAIILAQAERIRCGTDFSVEDCW